MNDQVVILIDGAFFEQRFINLYGKNPTAHDVEKEVKKLMKIIQKKPYGDHHTTLLRVYYYDCPPYEGVVPHHDSTKEDIDFSKARLCQLKKTYLNDLKLKPQFALRLGHLLFAGWKVDLYNNNKIKPDFKQKSVDMKIGLDMATIASKKTANKMILITGDADFISPMKWVRKEGILIYLALMGAQKINFELKVHADFVIESNESQTR